MNSATNNKVVPTKETNISETIKKVSEPLTREEALAYMIASQNETKMYVKNLTESVAAGFSASFSQLADAIVTFNSTVGKMSNDQLQGFNKIDLALTKCAATITDTVDSCVNKLNAANNSSITNLTEVITQNGAKNRSQIAAINRAETSAPTNSIMKTNLTKSDQCKWVSDTHNFICEYCKSNNITYDKFRKDLFSYIDKEYSLGVTKLWDTFHKKNPTVIYLNFIAASTMLRTATKLYINELKASSTGKSKYSFQGEKYPGKEARLVPREVVEIISNLSSTRNPSGRTYSKAQDILDSLIDVSEFADSFRKHSGLRNFNIWFAVSKCPKVINTFFDAVMAELGGTANG